MDQPQAIHVMTIANSIIGVGILAMPYCFKQCGIILSMVILIVSSIISRLSCHLLLKSAIMARRRTFEFLAFHAFGPLGKFIIEIGLIGFLLGTCIAFFVVMGDLGPAIVAKMTGTLATDTLRTSILMALALFCVLPLGLLRNIDSLSSVCTATIGFYFCLVLKIIVESTPHIFSGDWISRVELWRPAGFLQCLPIFSMALFCQTQIFEIYQAIPNASLDKMNNLIRTAVNICTGVYVFVGVFGYIAFCNQTFTGNILMSFPSTLMSEAMKIGFVLSVAFSFPLVIFPCRASLYSLLYKQTYSLHEGTDKYIPEGRFKGLTFIIVFVSLVTGVMIPNIELVLGLVGSTIGIMICVLFPAMCFICISSKNTNERILAQIMLFIGVIVMVLGTYANLYAIEEIAVKPVTEKIIIPEPAILKLMEEDPALKVIDIPNTTKAPIELKVDKKEEEEIPKLEIKEVRHEPPQPEAPPDVKEVSKEQVDIKKLKKQENHGIDEMLDKSKDLNIEKPIEESEDNVKNKKDVESPVLQEPFNQNLKESDDSQPNNKNLQAPEGPIENKLSSDLKVDENADAVIKDNLIELPPKLPDVKVSPIEIVNVEKIPNIEGKEQEVEKKSNSKKADEVDKEAIEKEEKELLEQEKENLKEEEKKKLDLIKSLEKRNEEQKKIVEEKKKILAEIKQRQQALEEDNQQKEIEKVKQEKMKAVEEIEKIAKKAIKKLSGNEEKDDIEKVRSQSNPEPKDVQIKVKPQEIDSQIPDDIISNDLNSRNSNLNLNSNDINQKKNVDERPKEAELKIGLNKDNLVPLPIAISNNNLSEVYKNMVVAVRNDIPKEIAKDDPSPKVNDVIKPDKIEQSKEKEVVVNKQDEKAPNKGDPMNLLEVLRTKAEKVTILNQEKQEKAIHREIRSLKDIATLQDISAVIEKSQNGLTVQENVPEIPNENVLGKSKESCDKDDQKESGSSEAPIIKMITKLSEPELVSLKLPNVDGLNVDSILKPLKRDLKSYKFRKRK